LCFHGAAGGDGTVIPGRLVIPVYRVAPKTASHYQVRYIIKSY